MVSIVIIVVLQYNYLQSLVCTYFLNTFTQQCKLVTNQGVTSVTKKTLHLKIQYYKKDTNSALRASGLIIRDLAKG